jgi:REP element-mobilizing transposase RayT
MEFKPFNPEAKTARHRRDLPHWQQRGTTYFVTFRLADSLPEGRRKVLEEERQDWLTTRGMNSVKDLERQPAPLRMEYARTFNAKWHSILDAGYGACVLRDPVLRAVAVEALRHFDGKRLHLDRTVVMPNHVHSLITPFAGYGLGDLLHSIKRFSARQINSLRNQRGTLWLEETFDHIVRSEKQLIHFREYIDQNPAKARLPATAYWLGEGGDKSIDGTERKNA